MNDDRSAIEAIKQGDRERFAELVERHKRMVYGIAWSYLGNAEICEDASQETFVRAYRYLGALRNYDTFASWLSRIARNVSITILRKRRKELESHKRWQSEQPDSVAVTGVSRDDKSLKEMLGRTLAELPPQHRECLVLFYLEGKNVRDTAAVLGLSEEALKTRLHRARAVLRGQLEQQVEEELSGLSPRANFVAAVMLILPHKTCATAGIGGMTVAVKAAAWLGSLASSMIYYFWMILGNTAFLYFIMRWFARMEIANLINKPENEFRKALLRRNALMVTIVGMCTMAYAIFAISIFGYCVYFQILAAFCAWGAYQCLLWLRVNRSPFVLGQTLAMFTFLLTSVLMGFFGAPPLVFPVALLLLNSVLAFANRKMPRRQDYSLFLRQAHGRLGKPNPELQPSGPATQPELRAFARFLGEQFLVRGYSVKGATLALRLPPVRAGLMNSLLMTTAGASWITIDNGRECRAFLSASDARAIEKLLQRPIEKDIVSDATCLAVRSALTCFLRGEEATARQLLSTVADEAIFISDFSSTRGYRIQAGISIVAAALLVCGSIYAGAWRWGLPFKVGAVDGAPASQAMARQALGDWIRNDRPSMRPELLMLWSDPASPSMQLLGEQNASDYKTLIAQDLRESDGRTQGPLESRISEELLRPNLLYHAITASVLSSQELEALGFTPVHVRQTLTALGTETCSKLFDLQETTHRQYRGQTYTEYRAADIESFAMRLTVLNHFGCLDFLDSEAAAKTIASYQVTSGVRRPDRFRTLDTVLASGLFQTAHCGLSETRAALSALRTLGRIDLIDREACIAGILRSYQGNGIFKVSDPLGSGVMIRGKDRDAFCAMESLAMLDALGRIEDFNSWKFQSVTHAVTVNGQLTGAVTAESLLSYAYQERLVQLLQ